MHPPARLAVIACAALATATPLLAGALAWHFVDDAQRGGAVYVLLYWPSILFGLLPPAAAAAFTLSALPTVLVYFAGYLLLYQLVRETVRVAGRGR